MRNFLKRKNVRRSDSKYLLIKGENNNAQDDYDHGINRYNTPLAQNTYNTNSEQHLQSKAQIPLQELAELLDVASISLCDTFEDGCCCTTEPNSALKQDKVYLIQKSVSKHFSKLLTHLDQNLCQHLEHVHETVLHELVRLGPLLEPLGLMGCLIDCYHNQTFDHLDVLLQDTTSTQNILMLIKWVQHVYHSKELPGHFDFEENDPFKKVDVELFQRWMRKAKDKLLKNVQKDVRTSLENILQIEKNQKRCDSEETYVGLNVDIIQCIDAMNRETRKISSELTHHVQEVCFQELLIFTKRYSTEQTEALRIKAKQNKPETIYFLKTLKTCKELKLYVQKEGVNMSLLSEMEEILDNMEASTIKLLMDVVTAITESHLKKYFKSKSMRFLLCVALKEHFPKLQYVVDEHKRVMDEIYKLIVRIYINYLVRSSQKTLRTRWSHNLGETVTKDAKLLHSTISDLAPDVQQWNVPLLKVTDILECENLDTLKLTGATMQAHYFTTSCMEDMHLLRTLLHWKGLPRGKVREVLSALPDDLQPRPDPGRQCKWTASWCGCFLPVKT